MATKRKHQGASLEFKKNLNRELDKGIMKKTEICKKFGMPNSTLSTILKNREKIEKSFESSTYSKDRKRMRTGNYEELEAGLFTWFTQARTIGIPVSGTILQEKANSFAEELGIDFVSNPGWLERFKQRKGITFKVVRGESADAPTEHANDWITSVLIPLLQKYQPQDVFNADETGLFFQCLPDKTLSLKDDECKGGKKAKSRLSILVGANMDGSEKLPLLCIGKSAKPRCFKSVKQLPVTYYNNKKAWMTSVIFENWLRKLDNQMSSQMRKILLIVDNCPAHPKLTDLTSIQLVFLPPNTTSLIQPCDQGIIASLKANYRKTVVRKLILHTEQQMKKEEKDRSPFNISILDTMFFIRAAWNEVATATIANCFRHAKFTLPSSTEDSENLNPAPVLTQDDDYGNLFERLQDVISLHTTATAYLQIDDKVVTAETQTDKEIIDSLHEEKSDEEQEELASCEVELLPTVNEMQSAMNVIHRYVQAQANGNEMYDTLEKLDRFIETSALKSVHQ